MFRLQLLMLYCIVLTTIVTIVVQAQNDWDSDIQQQQQQTSSADRFITNQKTSMLESILMRNDEDQPLSITHDSNNNNNNNNNILPVVQMHGMGDFAKDPAGMIPLAKSISKALNNTYVTNIQIGKSIPADVMNGFLMNMDDQIEYFKSIVTSDDKLKNGFNAIGYSQGNLIIRGYIHRYNDPPVLNHLSMHGPMMGVAGIPQCNVDDSSICKIVDNLLHFGAYNSFVQNHLAQANYLRDPLHIQDYLKNGKFLVDINNEKRVTDTDMNMNIKQSNDVYVKNFEKLEKLILVKADEDSMVIPNESEWFGAFKDGSLKDIVVMKDTKWYQENWFGLKTLNEQNKLVFLSTPGDHLQFSNEFLIELVEKYFT